MATKMKTRCTIICIRRKHVSFSTHATTNYYFLLPQPLVLVGQSNRNPPRRSIGMGTQSAVGSSKRVRTEETWRESDSSAVESPSLSGSSKSCTKTIVTRGTRFNKLLLGLLKRWRNCARGYLRSVRNIRRETSSYRKITAR